jgi:hypothetical protein
MVRSGVIADRSRLKNRVQSLLAQLLVVPPVKVLITLKGIQWLHAVESPAEVRSAIDMDLRQYETVDQELRKIDDQLTALAYEDGSAKLLTTLPSIAHGVAMSLLPALSDISRLMDGDHAASYLGLTPRLRQSVAKHYHGRIAAKKPRRASTSAAMKRRGAATSRSPRRIRLPGRPDRDGRQNGFSQKNEIRLELGLQSSLPPTQVTSGGMRDRPADGGPACPPFFTYCVVLSDTEAARCYLFEGLRNFGETTMTELRGSYQARLPPSSSRVALKPWLNEPSYLRSVADCLRLKATLADRVAW